MTRSLRPTAKILCAILWILVLSSVLAAQVSPSAKSSLSDKKVSQAIRIGNQSTRGSSRNRLNSCSRDGE